MPPDWKANSETALAVHAAGFNYDPSQDIIYSRDDAWQRKFGYAWCYDLAAPVTISAIIDCEPFFFHHGGKHWMIELWKGQYGLETGAEIGVYNDDDKDISDTLLGSRPHDKNNAKFFKCAEDSERLTMSFTLERDGEVLFSRGPEKHWWLTGFKWGVFSEPEQLAMKLSIEMPDANMRQAFVDAVEATGYEDVRVEGPAVKFTFSQPKTVQARKDSRFESSVRMARTNDKKIVGEYQQLGLPNNDPNAIQGPVTAKVIRYFSCQNADSLLRHEKAALAAIGVNASKVKEPLTKVFKVKAGFWRQLWLSATGRTARWSP
jgi:hypothetical protein